MIINMVNVKEYDKLRIPVLEIEINNDIHNIINICNSYLTTIKMFENRVGIQTSDLSKKDPYEAVRDLCEKLGYKDLKFGNNCELLIAFFNANTKLYSEVDKLFYIEYNHEDFIFTACCKGSMIEMIPRWGYEGVDIEVIGYNNAIVLNKDSSDKQLPEFKTNKDFNFPIAMTLKGNKYILKDSCYKYIKTISGGFYRVNLGDLTLVFLVGTRHYAVPNHRKYMMLLQGKKVLIHQAYPGGNYNG